MNYKKYQNSRNAAWEILIEQGVTELPVRVSRICQNMGIDVRMYSPKERDGDGKTVIIGKTPVILVSEHCSIQRQRFTAAHELGHIVLGHIGKYELVNREPSNDDSPVEQEANVFASRLLAPAIVLRDLNVNSAEDISRLCDISIQSATFRWERLKLLLQREQEFLETRGYSCFCIDPLERAVREQFDEYIEKNRL